MLHLASVSDPGWATRAAADIDAVLIDHAHLEKKAASTAMTLIFKYPEHVALLLPLSRLAREELEHFELVLQHLAKRGVIFQRQFPAPYAGQLRQAMRPNDPGRLLDQFLVCSVIEARSCERMRLLADHLDELRSRGETWVDRDGSDLVQLYRGLLAAEARHHRTYVDLAELIYPREEVALRLEEITAHEAKVVAAQPEEPRLHGK